MPVANNNFGQRPTLSRTTATQPIDVNNAMNSQQALDLRTKIVNAYSNMGFRGPAWCLPSGALVIEDVWEASLSYAEIALSAGSRSVIKTLSSSDLRKFLICFPCCP